MASEIDHNELGAAFWELTEDQIAVLRPHGEIRQVETGQTLFQQGDATCDFYVVLEGAVQLVEPGIGTPRVIGARQQREIVGELNLLTEEVAYLTAVVQQPGSVLAIPAETLRAIVTRDPGFSDFLLRAFLLLRSHLLGIGAGLKIVGSSHSADARRLRHFLVRNRVPHHWIDVESDPVAESLLRQFQVRPDETPVVIWRGVDVLRNPTHGELARLLGLGDELRPAARFDLVVIGAGPAGLAAAVYGACERVSEKGSFG